MFAHHTSHTPPPPTQDVSFAAHTLCTNIVWAYIGGTDITTDKSPVVTNIRMAYTRVTGERWDKRKHGEQGFHLWNCAIRSLTAGEGSNADAAAPLDATTNDDDFAAVDRPSSKKKKKKRRLGGEDVS